MPRNFYVLTDRDREALVGVIRQQSRHTSLHRSGNVHEDPGYSTQCYIALTPIGGIPARQGLLLGAAECLIYRVIDGLLVPLDGVARTVYNLYTTALAGEEWVTVKTDKFNTWLVDAQVTTPSIIEPGTGSEAAALSVKQSDGSTVYPDITQLQFPATSITNPSADIIVIGKADKTHDGFLTTASQDIAGSKHFTARQISLGEIGGTPRPCSVYGKDLSGVASSAEVGISAPGEVSGTVSAAIGFHLRSFTVGSFILGATLHSFHPTNGWQNPCYKLINSTGFEQVGIYDTLQDGSIVQGGIITTKGSNSIDGGSF